MKQDLSLRDGFNEILLPPGIECSDYTAHSSDS
jgi:hypothetical protein